MPTTQEEKTAKARARITSQHEKGQNIDPRDHIEQKIDILHFLLLLPCEHDGSEDGDEDQNAGDLEGKQEIAEEHL